MMTNVMPTATRPRNELASRMFRRLSTLANRVPNTSDAMSGDRREDQERAAALQHGGDALPPIRGARGVIDRPDRSERRIPALRAARRRGHDGLRWRWMKTAPRMIAGLDHPGRRVGQVVGDQRGRDELHQHRARQRAHDAHPAAGQRGSADDHGGDRAELDQVADERRVGRTEAGRLDDPGERGQGGAQDVHGEQRPANRNAREGARVGIAPDRHDVPPERRPRDDHPHDQGNSQRDQDHVGHAQEAARSDGAQERVEDLGQSTLGDHQGQAAAADQQRQASRRSAGCRSGRSARR